jgi:hypothetical protein
MRTALSVAALFFLFGAAALAGDGVEANGKYIWVDKGKKRDEGLLKAVFTPDGDNKWKVTFYFAWKKKKHVYKGTATGSLKNGAIAGEVKSDDKKPRTFAFSGNAANGEMTGKHWEIRVRKGKRRETPTGTFTLSL